MRKYVLYRNDCNANEMEFITSSYVQACMKAGVNHKLTTARLHNSSIPAHNIVAVSKKYIVVKIETRTKK